MWYDCLSKNTLVTLVMILNIEGWIHLQPQPFHDMVLNTIVSSLLLNNNRCPQNIYWLHCRERFWCWQLIYIYLVIKVEWKQHVLDIVDGRGGETIDIRLIFYVCNKCIDSVISFMAYYSKMVSNIFAMRAYFSPSWALDGLIFCTLWILL